jgi:cytosine/adenosine deaminase-related metal-dependent hydrolase
MLVAASLVSCRTSGGGDSRLRDASNGTPDLILVGYVPDRYVQTTAAQPAGNSLMLRNKDPGANNNGNNGGVNGNNGGDNGNNRVPPTPPPSPYVLAAVAIKGSVIEAVRPVTEAEANTLATTPGAVLLRNPQTLVFDVIYPGMMNLHNHTKQNVLPLWGEAKGQFANRFEWRDWNNYTKAVSQNMNPWINDGMATCAAFRWSELQAMVLGTTHLQGPSACISNFAIHQVEDEYAYPAEDGKRLAGVQAPTDLVVPEDMPFVWKHIKPLVDQGKTYEQALLQKIGEFCPRMLQNFTINDVNGQAELAVFKDKANVENFCDQVPDKFVRYLYWQHKTIAGKKNYLANPMSAGVIVHLAEGRRKDPYNTIEFEMLKIFGMDQPNVNLVHAVGLSDADFAHMAQKNMGLIWSPFSNLLLYGETVDIAAAVKAGVNIALGSDWTPTGSRGVLEELKIARAYVRKMNLDKVISDEKLYEMVTENPARMLKHFENKAGDGRNDLGRIVPEAAASLVVMARRDADPYKNFVIADAKDVNLVVVDGKPVYGEESYITKSRPGAQYESLPVALPDLQKAISGQTTFTYIPHTTDKDTRRKQLEAYAQLPEVAATKVEKACNFSKVFVHQDSKDQDIANFAVSSGLNLDRAVDIQKFLSLNILTMAYNNSAASGRADPAFALTDYPRMFTCDDAPYAARLKNFVSDDELETNDEISVNVKQRSTLRSSLPVNNVPQKLADLYGLPYDNTKDY